MGHRDIDVELAQDQFIRQRERELLAKFERPMGVTVSPMWARASEPVPVAVDWTAWVLETDATPEWKFAEMLSSDLLRARSITDYCYARAAAECERKALDYWIDDPFARRAA